MQKEQKEQITLDVTISVPVPVDDKTSSVYCSGDISEFFLYNHRLN